MMLNCLIVDDEPLALDLLENYVGRTPFLQLAGRAGSALEALQCLERFRQGEREGIDLIFLDIQMPQLSGIEFSRLLAERGGGRARVIFTTAFEQYAIEGFRVDALDYLLKPISYTEFLRAAMKAHDWFRKTSGGTVPAAGEPPIRRDSIWVRSDYRHVRVPLAEILYIEGVKDYVRICRADGSQVMTQASMKTMEGLLPKEDFVRVHRSYIVRLQQVNAIERGRIVFGKARIPISDSYRDDFMHRLAQRAFLSPGKPAEGETELREEGMKKPLQ